MYFVFFPHCRCLNVQCSIGFFNFFYLGEGQTYLIKKKTKKQKSLQNIMFGGGRGSEYISLK